VELLLLASAADNYSVGDILDIQEDGFAWGTEEISNPLFTIISVPNAQMGGDRATARSTYLVENAGVHTRRWRVQGTGLREKLPEGGEITRRTLTRRARP